MSEDPKSASYNKLSIIGFTFSIFAFIVIANGYIELGALIWLAAAIIGVVALKQIRNQGGKGKWFAIIIFLIPLVLVGLILLTFFF